MDFRRELARKAIHLSSAAVPVGYAAGVPRPALLALLGALLVVAVVVEVARARHEQARAHFTRAAGALLREHEHAGISGATWLLAAFLAAVWLLPRQAAIAATWAVAVGDASAALVGRWWRARCARRAAAAAPGAPAGVLPAGKSLAGSAACLAATAVGALFVARLDPGAALAAGLAAALAERPRIRFDDNARIAAAVGVTVVLWARAFS